MKTFAPCTHVLCSATVPPAVMFDSQSIWPDSPINTIMYVLILHLYCALFWHFIHRKKKKKITLTYFWRETRASRLGTNHWLHKYPQHLPGQIYTSKYSEHHPTPCRQHRDVWIQVPGGSRRWDGWNKCSQNKDKSRLRACCESAREPGAGMRFIFPARQRRQT